MSLLAHGKLAGLEEIADTGRDRLRGGYSRHLWQAPELELREWFIARARKLGLDVETDLNGNLWAWWGESGPDALVLGSHLDSVPGGGEYDGPLGVVSALAAIEALQLSGDRPPRPVAVVVFAEEEGSRFGIACLGSRLLSGAIDPDRARSLRDRDGVSFAEAAQANGLDPRFIGREENRLSNIGLFLELHVEQGRGLIDQGSALGVASSILAHGRWRVHHRGEGNHAGATRMVDRRDPLIAAARTVAAIRDTALATAHGRATVGRIEPIPGGTNVIASAVDTWIDARSDNEAEVHDMLATITAQAELIAEQEGCEVVITEESWSPTVHFDPVVRDRCARALGDVPILATGAGHDAGVLSAHVPTAMLFVRNPTGVSHAPEEFASAEDCTAGVAALASIVRGLR